MKKACAFFLLIVMLLLMEVPQNNPRIRLQSQSLIHQPVTEVWEQLSDLSQVQNYVPFVSGSNINTDQKKGEGVQRTVWLKKRRTVQEEVIEWDDGQGYVLRLNDASFFLPFHDMETRYHIDPDDELGLQSDLTITLTVRPRFGLLGRWFMTPWITTRLQRQLDELADGIKYHFETGLQVSEDVQVVFPHPE
ncbi:SRPBCC family protein [Endozoicomonas lisbonensis]|uniref:SRPBCC family protein n=1 Tax=Endozoicomonas lisbonensis TaxID=3120522 RepID=A0ABV2SIN7_9GAMM